MKRLGIFIALIVLALPVTSQASHGGTRIPCSGTSDCTGGMFCSFGECTHCIDNSECGPGAVCNDPGRTTGICEGGGGMPLPGGVSAPSGHCTADENCADEELCNLSTNTCVLRPTPPPVPEGEPLPQVVLPRLQVHIPGLTPFTNPFREPTVVTEGDKRVLYIDFLAVYISAIYRYLIGIVGIVAGVTIVWAGIKWLTAGGMPDRIGSAKKQIAGAIMGLIIALGAYVILFVVNPELTRLKPLRIEVVEKIELGLQEVETEEASETPAIAGQERRIVEIKNDYMQNYMRVGEHMQETIKNVARELHNETENMPGGPYKLAGGGYRTVDVQVTKWKNQCEGRPTCGTPVCSPFEHDEVDANNNLLPGATPNGANCPHTSGQAVDLRCSCPSTLDTQECNKYASTSPKFFAPCQKKLEEIMARKGFCRLRSEPWHFENPKMMGTCDAGLVGSAQRRRPAKSWNYQSCNGVYNMQTAECEPLPR